MSRRRIRLKYLAATPISNGLGLSGAFDESKWPRYIRTTDIKDERTLRDDVFASQPPDVAAGALVQPRDILMTAAGATIGKSYLHYGEEPACYAGYLALFRPRPDVDERFISFWMQSSDYWAQIDTGAVRSTIDNFSAGKYRQLLVPDLPLDKQRLIADFLDDQIERLDKAVRLRREQVVALVERMDSAWASQAASLMSTCPVAPLRRVLSSIVDGPFGSSLTSAHYSAEGTRVIRLGNLGRCDYRYDDEAFIPAAYGQQLSAHAVEPGDLLIAGLGDETWPLGRATVAPDDLGDAIVKADCYRARLAEGQNAEFLAWFMSSPVAVEAFKLLSRGSTRARLNTAVVRDLQVPLASLAQQESTLRGFRRERLATNAAVSEMTAQIALLEERRRSLISAAVTGEFDVPSASGRRF